MRKSVSIQDIADTLGMSRNTVSKALNGKHVPVKTRNAVISAAIEMGYKGYKLAATSEGAIGHKRYVILSTRLLMNITFFISVLKGIEESLMDYDIDLVQFSITNSASFAKFKRYLTDAKVDGIICMEFFEPDYIAQLLEQSIPLVFFDFPLLESAPRGSYDIILPEVFQQNKKSPENPDFFYLKILKNQFKPKSDYFLRTNAAAERTAIAPIAETGAPRVVSRSSIASLCLR